jgi:hypothetical protein
MLFNVPQYIEIEDKIAGPLTGKQLLWMFGMGGVLLILWGILETGPFIMSAIPVAMIFCALAFYRPHGQPLIKFIIWGISFAFQPKTYIWRRDYVKEKKREKKSEAGINILQKNKEKKEGILSENIVDFARTLDSEGRERNEKMLAIIKQNRQAHSKK